MRLWPSLARRQGGLDRSPLPFQSETTAEHVRTALTLIRLILQTNEPCVGNEGPGFCVPVKTLDAIQRRLERALERLAGLVLVLLLSFHQVLRAQVPAVTQVSADTRLAAFTIGNPTVGSVHILVALFRDSTPANGRVTLGSPLPALITPSDFALPPGASQTVRILVRTSLVPGDRLRLVTTFTPQEPPNSTGNIRIGIVTRLISRVEVVP